MPAVHLALIALDGHRHAAVEVGKQQDAARMMQWAFGAKQDAIAGTKFCFPTASTFTKDGFYGACALCLWEDDGLDGEDQGWCGTPPPH